MAAAASDLGTSSPSGRLRSERATMSARTSSGSTTTASLVAKWLKNVRCVTPAAAAMSVVDVAS